MGKSIWNFDEYTSRESRYQYNKMKETIEGVKEGGNAPDSHQAPDPRATPS